MLNELARRYLPDIDALMRRVVDMHASSDGDFDRLLRYPLGWVNEDGSPYNQPTGKRIRPLLLLLCAEAVGGDWHDALPAAAAVELLHNFSLIHDDIQDNSPKRHGRPTVWKIWGRSNAINAGDGMFTLAYCALEKLSETTRPEIALKVWNVFNRTNLELTRGQHLDMLFEHKPNVTVDDYLSMIEGKSAALVAACAHMGALIGSGNDDTAGHFDQFGLNLGLAFQIRDDILGIWGDPAKTGKSAATDIISRKKSLPALYGLAKSDRLKALYGQKRLTKADVHEAVKLLNDAGAYEFALKSEADYYTKAINSLDSANPQGTAADGLRKLAESLYQRDR